MTLSSVSSVGRTMGIINITPNSFSDGGVYFPYQDFQSRLQELFKLQVPLVDIGAESTAPMNSSITPEEEQKRFKKTLFPFLLQEKWPVTVSLSIDTYREETFSFIYGFIKDNSLDIPLVWNDVSGKVDKGIIHRLKYQYHDCSYVCGHSLVPQRDLVSEHMNYIFTGSLPSFLQNLKDHFLGIEDQFRQADMLNRIFFDPCFGFSKSKEQNIYLLKHLPWLVRSFSVSQKWLIGISKKSFLRKLGEFESFEQSERIHCYLLGQWMQELCDFSLFFRVHDPSIPLMASVLSTHFPFLKDGIKNTPQM